MQQYLDNLKYILDNGEVRDDRTGVGTIGVFGLQTRYDLRKTFPAPTTKKLAWKGVVSELLWFLEGSTDERRLAEIRFEKNRSQLKDKVTIWTGNANNQGVSLGYENNKNVKELGPVYGFQWRFWGNDQIEKLIKDLKQKPYSRRHILSAWNANEIEFMSLPPCHVMSQFYVSDEKVSDGELYERYNGELSKPDFLQKLKDDDDFNLSYGKQKELSCQLYQRSADMFLGVPFNIASYALLTHIIAKICGYKVGEFVHTLGDAHIYSNHVEQVKEQLSRIEQYGPTLSMPEFSSIDELIKLKTSDFVLNNYNPQSSISAPMAV